MKSRLGIFRTTDGRSHGGTFALVCGIFVCTGLCNRMIDSLNKHFQNSFEVSKAASGTSDRNTIASNCKNSNVPVQVQWP